MRYEIYKKTTDGKRGTIIENYKKFDATLRFNEVGKWQLSGSSRDFSPLNEGDGIIVYRNGVPFISGFVTNISEEVDETHTDGQTINWTAEGSDDNGLLSRRVIIPDPVNLDLSAAAYQTIRDYGGNAILDYINTQAGLGAKAGRNIPNLTVDTDKNLGVIQTFNARLQNLWEFCVGISSGQALGIWVVWDGEVGQYTATVYTPEDKSDLIIFSREFGNIKKWSRKRTAPKANAIWVAGQGEKVERMFAYREDAASIAKWGRFEAVKDRRDLSNEQDVADPRTPQQILDDTAEELIEANKATEGYELELAPIERMSYRDDWELGDIVKVRVGTTEFQAIIEEVKIDYAGGIETVTPSVGTINRGAIAKTYSTIQAIGERVAVLERNEGQSGIIPIQIPANADLNWYVVPGFYNCPTDAAAQTLVNRPCDCAFSMQVLRDVGEGWVSQIVYPRAGGWQQPLTFKRGSYPTWQGWHFYNQWFDSGWVNASLLNGWQDWGGWGTVGFRNLNNNIKFRGLVKKTDNNYSYTQILFYLPAAYRPPENYMFTVSHQLAHACLAVAADGSVKLQFTTQGSANTWLNLHNISYFLG